VVIKVSYFFFVVIECVNSEMLVKVNRTLEHLSKYFQGIRFSAAFNLFGLVTVLFGFIVFIYYCFRGGIIEISQKVTTCLIEGLFI
jgi:hypothetical protein